MAGFAPGSQIERELDTKLRAEANAISIGNIKDEIRWSWDNSGRFSVKSLYNFLQDGGVVDKRFAQLWKIGTPLKVKIFVWLVLKKRVLTADNLLKRGRSGEGMCSLCSEGGETMEHLFMSCPFTKDLLLGLLPNKRMLLSCTSSVKLWEEGSLIGGTYGRKQLAIIWWATWLERNRRIFETKKQTNSQLLAEIKSLRQSWYSLCTN